VHFDERTSEIILGHGGQLVKTIGDEVLFATQTTDAACAIALDLVEEFADVSLPDVRVGLAAGEVVSIFGDVFGPRVNLAARLVARAEPNTAFVDDRVQRESAQSFAFTTVGDLTIKGFVDLVPVFRLDARRT
jgi:adenylate cyclase